MRGRVTYLGLKRRLEKQSIFQAVSSLPPQNFSFPLRRKHRNLYPSSTINLETMVGPSINSKPPAAIKFLCSYGGKIVPRYPDGKLRYQGGETRVLAVDRSISFADLLLKLGDLCGASEAVGLRCQLPKEDLDALVSVTSDEDLANLIEEYDRSSTLKIRAFLILPKKLASPISSSSSSVSSTKSSSSSNSNGDTIGPGSSSIPRCHHQMSLKTVAYPAKRMPRYHVPHGNHGSHVYLVHGGNHWQ